MANVPISSLPVASSLSASDISPWVVSGTTSRLAYSVLQALILNPSATTASLAGANTVVFLISGTPTAISWTNLQTLIQASVQQAGIPVSDKAVDYTLVLSDGGKAIRNSDAAASHTFTIPSNASVPFPIGTTLTFIANGAQTVSIAINTDTLSLAGVGTTGTRTLSTYGIATAIKFNTTSWYISGTGLS